MKFNLKDQFIKITMVACFGMTLLFTSCEKDAAQILEEEGISLADIQGKWSITNEARVTNDASGAQINSSTESYVHNFKTIEFESDNSLRYIDVKESEWILGTFTFNDVDESLELDFDVEVTTLSIVSLVGNTAEFQIVEEEEENGEIYTSTTTITLSKNTGSEASIAVADLKTKWSMGSNNVYVNDQLITSDLLDEMWMETSASIDDNMYTLDLKANNTALSIDNYMTGTYDEGDFEVLDGSNFVVDLEGHEPFLFHITANDGSGDMTVVHYRATEQVDFKVEQAWSNDFSASSLNLDLIAGSWEVMAKTEGRELNGLTATPEGEGPEVGNIITFYSNGSGIIGNDQFTFTFIDESNIALISAGETDYTLIHLSSFNGTNEMSIWNMYSKWNETNTQFEQEWIEMDMVK